MIARPRQLAALCGALLLVAEASAQVLVHGHRGARGEYPENTLPGFRHALEIGVDVLELDLAVSRDDVLVINHDLTVNHTLCEKDQQPIAADQAVRSLSWEELRQFDCGSLANPRFPEQKQVPGTPMPRLEELFQLVADSPLPVAKTVHFNIETKIDPRNPALTPEPEHYARLLVAAITRAGLRERAIVQSFDHRTLKWVKRLDPDIRVSQLTFRNYVDLVAAVRGIDGEYLSPDWESLTAEIVQDMHAAGIRVAPWTANTEASWQRLVDLDVDEIITDYPTRLLAWLRERQLHP